MMPPTITFTGNAPMKAEGQKDAPKGAGEAAFVAGDGAFAAAGQVAGFGLGESQFFANPADFLPEGVGSFCRRSAGGARLRGKDIHCRWGVRGPSNQVAETPVPAMPG